MYGNNAYIYDYSKTGQSQDGSNAGQGQSSFGGQVPSRSYESAPDASNSFNGQPGTGFGSQGVTPGFGATQPGSTGFGPSQLPSSGFGGSQPSNAFGTQGTTGFGTSPSGSPGFGTAQGYPSLAPSQNTGAPAYPAAVGAPSFGAVQPSSSGFGVPQAGANIPSTGFGQPAASHSPGSIDFHIKFQIFRKK